MTVRPDERLKSPERLQLRLLWKRSPEYENGTEKKCKVYTKYTHTRTLGRVAGDTAGSQGSSAYFGNNPGSMEKSTQNRWCAPPRCW